jgi:hypothetical protein
VGPAGVAASTPTARRCGCPGFWLACAGILLAVLGLGITEGVLPLHVADQLSQAQIGGLYVGVALLVAASSAVAGSAAPRSALAGGSILVVVGIAVAGAAGTIPLVVLALASAGIGIGAGQTGATGVLLQAVAPERT